VSPVLIPLGLVESSEEELLPDGEGAGAPFMVPGLDVSLVLFAAIKGMESAQAKPASASAEPIFMFMRNLFYREGGEGIVIAGIAMAVTRRIGGRV
jgi:hypothetical protein